jgi:molecular chaperone DnaJ
MRSRATCPECRGTGSLPEKKCNECTGTGVKKKTAKFSVKIPAGIDDNQMIRLDGEGEMPAYGGRAGDLYVRVRVKPSKEFTRKQYDILTELEVSFAQAALGTHVDVDTVDGKIELKIPAGTQSGKIFRLRDKGVPHLGSSSDRGDQLVTVTVITPTKLSKKDKKLFQDLAALHAESVDAGGGLFGF